MWCIQKFASPPLNNFPLAARETNFFNPPCQVISFSVNHVPSGNCILAIQHFLPLCCRCQELQSCCCNILITSHLITHRHSQAAPISLNTTHFHFFLLLIRVQLHSLAELCLVLFLHFLLYLVHGPIYSCFVSTASQPHAFFMALCASGF